MLRRFLIGAAVALTPLLVSPAFFTAQAAEKKAAEEAAPAHEEIQFLSGRFSFTGIFGTIDKASAQRGLQIYTEKCSACHSLNFLSYRNIHALGYTEDQVKAYAAQYEVPDEPNDDGKVLPRKARPSDGFVKPFANEKQARAANNGALPPDLSVIVNARENGVNYLYSLMQGYEKPPADMKMNEGMYYNKYFPGHQIAMPPPLEKGTVTYADGTAATLEQEARDITTFLEWAAEPELDARKRLGAKVVLFLLILTAGLYAIKRKIWAKIH